jgi:hypothetical protein
MCDGGERPAVILRGKKLKTIFGVIGAILAFGAVVFGLNYAGLASYGFFAPRYEAVRRDTMIQSRAYSEASTREMYRFKLQYLLAKTDDERSTIRAFALHESAAFERDRLPNDLQAFLNSLGG